MRNLSTLRALVFDLDGTLLNTITDIGAACNAVLGKHGYPQHPLLAYTQMVGCGFDVLVQRALPVDRMPDAEAIDVIINEAKTQYAAHMLELTQPYDGMPETLETLANCGFDLAVLSNKPDAMSVELIRHYFPNIPFTFVRGAISGVPLKPDPSALLQMLAKMGADKDFTGYVGDSDVDMFTARNADVAGLGAGWGFRGPDELAGAGADRVLMEPAELLTL